MNIFSIKKTIFISLVLITVSIVGTLFIALINDSIFLEPLRDAQFREMFEAGEIPKPPYKYGPPVIEVEPEWPSSSYVFYYGILSCYWFLLGGFIAFKYRHFPKKALFAVPVISNLINISLMLIGYVALCFIGNIALKSYFEKKSQEG